MIIRWLLDEHFDSLAESDGFLEGVTEVLRAHRTGSHLLIIDRLLASRLLDLPISAHEKALLQRLSQEYTQTGRLYQLATVYVQLDNRSDREISINGSAIIVPFPFVTSTRILERPALVVENLEADGLLYEEILRYASEKAGRGNVAIEVVHGGGTDICRVFSKLIKEKRIVCAIADSDKNSPTSPKTFTLRKLEKLVEQANWPLARVGSPACREVENVVPFDVILQLPCAVSHATNSIILDIMRREEALGTPPDDLYWNYFDIKLGIGREKLESLDADAVSWLKGKLELVINIDRPWEVRGYGETIISQIMADGAHIAELRRHLGSGFWRSIHWAFFGFFAWFFVSTRRLVT